MTVPRTLNLIQTANGVRLTSLPVKEMQDLRQQNKMFKDLSIKGEINLTPEIPFSVTTSEIVLEFANWNESTDFGIRLFNSKGEEVRIGFDSTTKQYYLDRSRSGKSEFSPGFSGKHVVARESADAVVRMQLLVDASSIELFADDGQVVMTDVFFPNEDFDQVSLYARSGQVDLKSGSINDLKSIW